MKNVRSEPVFVTFSNSSNCSNQFDRKKKTKKTTQLRVHPLISSIARLLASENLKLDTEFNPNAVYFVVSVDRKSLNFVLANEENRRLFVILLFAAHSVCFHSILPD